MPGGLLSLVCYGNENQFVNGNPQTTNFYKAFVHYTHFSQEPYQIPVDGPKQLQMDAPILVKAKIPRNGDLLSDLVLRFTLPDIFSKAYLREITQPPTASYSSWSTTVTNVSASGNTFTKVSGITASWDAQAYSTRGFVSNVYCCATPSSVQKSAFGLAISPSTDSSLAQPFNGIQYGFKFIMGSAYIVESGTTVSSFVYSPTDNFCITYDGRTITYSQNTTVLRTIAVPQPFQTYYFDSWFNTLGDSLTNVSFGQEVLKNVAVSGQTFFKTQAGRENAWDSQAYSLTGYTSNVKCCATPTSVRNSIFGFATSPSKDSSFNGIQYGINIQSSGAYIVESGTTVTTGLSYEPTDVFCITYDGRYITYYQNTTILRQIVTPQQFIKYYFNSLYYNVGDQFTNVQFTPLGLTNVDVSGQTYSKTLSGTTGTWDAHAYSVNGFSSNLYCCATPSSVQASVFGLAATPSTNSSFNGIQYGFRFLLASVSIVESGTTIVSTTYSPTDTFCITYDGTYISYYQNKTLLRKTTTSQQSQVYYFDSWYNVIGDTFTNVVFGQKDFALDRTFEFAWVRQVGVRLIDTVTFTIGGTKIQEFTSDWISARAGLDYDNTTYQKWRSLVGDIPDCFDPANGVYAAPGGLYPNVVAWRGSTSIPNPVQNNTASIPGRVIRVPLGLWFSDFISNSLPLVALQYHESEIQIKLRPIRDLYTILDPTGVRLRSNIQSVPYIPTDQYTQVWNPNLLGPLPPTLNNLYKTTSDISGNMKYFLTDISGGIPIADGWPMNLTLEALYTFVTPEEQRVFTSKPLRYNVRQVQNFIFNEIKTRETYRLDVHNIATRLVFFSRRSDAIPFRNQSTNLTNWINTQGASSPQALPVGQFTTSAITIGQPGGFPTQCLQNGQLVQLGVSGLNIQGLQRRILRNTFLTANGQPLFDSLDPDYFTTYVPFRNLKGDGMPFGDYGLATQGEMWPIHVYSFALNGSSVEQPTGTLNFSRIDRFEMDIDVEPIPVLANYTYEIQVFVETLNFFEISNGLGGLKFAK